MSMPRVEPHTPEGHAMFERVTTEFNMIWQNDQDLYKAVLAYARELLRGVPGMTPQTIGRNVKDRMFAWAFGGGWGWPTGWPGSWRTFEYFLGRDQYRWVSETVVGEEVLDALNLEGYDPRDGSAMARWSPSEGFMKPALEREDQ